MSRRGIAAIVGKCEATTDIGSTQALGHGRSAVRAAVESGQRIGDRHCWSRRVDLGRRCYRIRDGIVARLGPT